MKRGVLVLVILIVLACVAVSAVGLFALVRGAITGTQEMGDKANAFMLAIRDHEPDKAYDLLAPQSKELVSLVNFREQFSNSPLSDWHFNSFNITDELGYIQGSSSASGNTYFTEFGMLYSNGQWFVSGYNLGELGRGGENIVQLRSND